MADNKYETLLALTYTVLGTGSDFEKSLSTNNEFRELLYEIFRVSAATFVVADSFSRRVVLLQRGIADSDGANVRLSIPLTRKPNNPRFCNESFAPAVVDGWINHIFQSHRESQGLHTHRTAISFSLVPEFFSGLRNNESNVSGDWVYVNGPQVLAWVIMWRWLLWARALASSLDSRATLTIRAINAKIANRSHELIPRLDNPGLQRLTYTAERAIWRLDSTDSWRDLDDGNEGAIVWQLLRSTVDTVLPQNTFEDELNRWNDFVPSDTRASFRKWLSAVQHHKTQTYANDLERPLDITDIENLFLWHVGKTTFAATEISELVEEIHERAPIPVAPYFYYMMIDQRVKEHFVVPIMRSECYPISYLGSDGNLQTHTAVVIAVAGLDYDGAAPERSSLGLLQLRTIFRILAERVIDMVFIGRLVDAERAGPISCI